MNKQQTVERFTADLKSLIFQCINAVLVSDCIIIIMHLHIVVTSYPLNQVCPYVGLGQLC